MREEIHNGALMSNCLTICKFMVKFAGMTISELMHGLELILANEPTIEDAYQKFLATEQNDTAPDQWCSQILARIVRKHKVIFVAEPEQKEMIEGLKMTYASDINEAYEMAKAIKGENASLTCIPNGISVIVRG